MSHKGIRLLLEKTAESIADDIQFSYATETDFNQSDKKGSILVNCAPLVPTPGYRVNGVSNFMKSWSAELVFYKPDKETGPQEYQKILDELDIIADDFSNELNFYSSMADSITITFGARTPFIKATADVLTGWLVPLQIEVMDQWDYCRDC